MQKNKLFILILAPYLFLFFSACSGGSEGSGIDVNFPVPGDKGSLTVFSEYDKSATISWTGASDNIDASGDLFYAVYMSENDNITTAQNCIDNGTRIENYQQNLYTVNSRWLIGELTPGDTVYFNVTVRDMDSNITAYKREKVTVTANDTIDTADDIEAGTEVSENISSGTDIDYFRVTLEAGKYYTITTDGSVEISGKIYNASGTELDGDINTGLPDSFYFVFLAPEDGEYYIGLDGYLFSIGEYDLIVATEDNETFEQAEDMTPGTDASGEIIDPGDIDFFKVSLVSGTSYVIRTTGSIDTIGQLFNADETLLASDDNTGDDTNFKIGYTAAATGDYYIKVVSTEDTGEYTLQVLSGDGNDSFEQAVDLTTVYYGSCDTDWDLDYYTIALEEGKTYNIFSDSDSSDPVGTLYNSSRVELASDDDSGDNSEFLITYTAGETGDYYVVVDNWSYPEEYFIYLEEVL